MEVEASKSQQKEEEVDRRQVLVQRPQSNVVPPAVAGFSHCCENRDCGIPNG